MTDQTISPTDDTVVQDADVVTEDMDTAEETVVTPTETTGADILINLEQSIKSNITGIDSRKSDLRKYRDMLSSAFTNDETYRIQDEDVKKTTKVRSMTKQQILKEPQNRQVAEKIKDLALEVKEMDIALSDYLREYQRLSGSNEIETEDGMVREIVYTAKLVKKAQKNR